MRSIDPGLVEKAGRRLGEAALDPAMWPTVMDEICEAAGATGALLLQSDVRTPDVPVTASIAERVVPYFHDGWHLRDERAARGVARVLRGEIITDQDLFTPDELRREPYFNECIYAMGLRWFAGVGFWAGSASWALSLQRTAHDGPFEPQDKPILAELSPRLTEAATLSTEVGRTVLTGMTNALNAVNRAALVVDRMGSVLDWNRAADRLFDDSIRVSNRRLMVTCREARAALDRLVDRMRATPDTASLAAAPIVVRRDGKPPVLIRALPISGAARSPFLGARALLTFSDLGLKPGPDPGLLRSVFGLTAAEAKLASLLASGAALDEIAKQLGISRETARNQLKAVFGKTETHRQAGLVALLSQVA